MAIWCLLSWVTPLRAQPPTADRVPSDLAAWETDTTKRAISLDELIKGCPFRDCIPSIDQPEFTDVRQADRWLDKRAPVAAVRVWGQARAYPLQILIQHEIVNDVIDGTPVAVTYCPLCNTTVAFDRRFQDTELTFGVSGFLRHSDLVMYDRQTETLWQQATGDGVVGLHTGEHLTMVPAPVMSWKDFKDAEPEGLVLLRETGFDRDYSRIPYRGYDERPGPIERFFGGRSPERLRPMHRVVGMGVANDGVAVPFEALRERRVITTEVEGEEVVVFWAPGTASVLNGETVDESKDIGAAGAFLAAVDGRRLRFRSTTEDGRFEDRETKSTWNISGQAISGPLQGTRLTPVQYTNAFWFAWGTFRPSTRIVTR